MIPAYPIKILSARWVIRFLPDKKFHRDDQARTDCADREIHFRLSKTTLEDILHELVHAYLDQMGLGTSIELTTEQLEESFCELFSKYGFTILLTASGIHRAYLELKKG